MHLQARVTVLRALRGAHVKSDACTNDDVVRPRVRAKPALHRDRRSSGGIGCRERAERPVPVKVDDRTPVLDDGTREKRPEGLEYLLGIVVAEQSDDLCRPLHVDECQGHSALGEVAGRGPPAVEALGDERS